MKYVLMNLPQERYVDDGLLPDSVAAVTRRRTGRSRRRPYRTGTDGSVVRYRPYYRTRSGYVRTEPGTDRERYVR